MIERPTLVVRNGTIVDGTGGELYEGDVAIAGERVVAVGKVAARGREEIDARGCLVTPGFVDIHTHYDGQVTWSDSLASSSWHGVTTVLMGNCGVGFAPCAPAHRGILMRLMEGVEDIPGIVLETGLPWTWQSFSEYLDVLGARRFDADVAAQLGHAPLRVYAMGGRGARREPATEADRERMRSLVCEAIRAGAFGVSTSRTIVHRSSDGSPTPTLGAAEAELLAIADGMRDAGAGSFQFISDFDDVAAEWAMLRRVIARSGRPTSLSLLQHEHRPDRWRQVLAHIRAAVDEGCAVKGQVAVRPVALIFAFNLSLCPFAGLPTYDALGRLPPPDRLRALRDPAVKARILAERHDDEGLRRRLANYANLYPLGDPPDYEPPASKSVASMAARAGRGSADFAYDLLLGNEGRAMLYRPLYNYAEGDLEVVRRMMTDRDTVLGLSDGGAHYGYICDASFPTYLITHWTRDRTRGERLALADVVQWQARDTARAIGLADRGVIAPGMKADLNVIDYDGLALEPPVVLNDLPGGGRRLAQRARGYVATVVSGAVTQRDGTPTGARPGRLLRRGASG